MDVNYGSISIDADTNATISAGGNIDIHADDGVRVATFDAADNYNYNEETTLLSVGVSAGGSATALDVRGPAYFSHGALNSGTSFRTVTGDFNITVDDLKSGAYFVCDASSTINVNFPLPLDVKNSLGNIDSALIGNISFLETNSLSTLAKLIGNSSSRETNPSSNFGTFRNTPPIARCRLYSLKYLMNLFPGGAIPY